MNFKKIFKKFLNLLTKPFIIIRTDGYYLDVEKPMEATKNDASILTTLLSRRKFRHFFKGDVFVLDRNFRNVLGELHKYDFRTVAPHFIEKGKKQLHWKQANYSRKVTKVRYTVEIR